MSVDPINRIETKSCKLRGSYLHYAIDAAKNPDLQARFEPFNLTLHPVRCLRPLLRSGERQSRLWRLNILDILAFAIIKVLIPALGQNQSGRFKITSCLSLILLPPFPQLGQATPWNRHGSAFWMTIVSFYITLSAIKAISWQSPKRSFRDLLSLGIWFSGFHFHAILLNLSCLPAIAWHKNMMC